jgi:hypothetical protein
MEVALMAETDAELTDPELNIVLSTPDIGVARAIVGAVSDLNEEMGTEIKVEVCQDLRADLQAIDDTVQRLVDRQQALSEEDVS